MGNFISATMKHLTLLAIFLGISYACFSQTTVRKEAHFSYDNNGNRVKREIVDFPITVIKRLDSTKTDSVLTVSVSSYTINVYPNPATNYAWIQMTGKAEKGRFSYAVISSNGGVFQLKENISFTSGERFKIDLSEAPLGMYFIRVDVSGQPIETTNLLKID